MHGPTSHTYFSQRLRLHYVDWGNPEAPPMILIHGGRDHCRNWDWVVTTTILLPQTCADTATVSGWSAALTVRSTMFMTLPNY